MIKVKNLSFKIGNKVILDNINFTIKKGEYVGLIGPNGAGKTTLVKLILGFFKPTSGIITFSDNVKIGYVPQNYELSNVIPISVEEVLSMSGVNKKKFVKCLKKLGLDETFLKKNFHSLSGGQKQRVMISRALCKEPNLLIFDEPLNAVDAKTRLKIYELLSDLNKNRNITIILISHDVNQVVIESDHVLCLEKTIHTGCHPVDFIHGDKQTCLINNDVEENMKPIHHHHKINK